MKKSICTDELSASILVKLYCCLVL